MSHFQEDSRPCLVRSEDGSVSFISLVFVLGLAVLIGFTGNMAHETVEREKLQNAADAAAYSSAVWMARGMNTVSTFNHIIGELTAVVVIIEALGGPQADGNGVIDKTPKELEFDRDIDLIKIAAPEFINFGVDITTVIQFANFIIGRDHNHSCSAAIYDAEVNLKMHALICLTGKVLGNVLEYLAWIPVAGALLLPIGEGIHLLMNVYMKVIEVEMRIVRGIEKAIPSLATIKSPLRQLIYAMDDVAKQVWKQFYSESKAGPLMWLEEDCILSRNAKRFKSYYQLNNLICVANQETIVKEPWERTPPKGSVYDAHPWSGDCDPTGIFGKIWETFSEISDALKEIPWWFSAGSSKSRIRGAQSDVNSNIGKNNKTPGWEDNPSIKTLNPNVNPQYEQKTQLVRATFPYVDMYRTPIRTTFSPLVLSKIKTFFTAWTYRYTLNESFELHCGGDKEIGNTEEGVRLMVMNGTTYGTEENKGNETWTDSAKEAEQMFSVFVCAEAQETPAVFSPSIYQKTQNQIAFSQAMFYSLNGRDMSKARVEGNTVFQANSGWDTLQWDPQKNIEDGGQIIAREWFSCDPEGGCCNLVSQIANLFTTKIDNKEKVEGLIKVDESFLKNLFSCQASSNARVKLNWQAKLRPVDIRAIKQVRDTGGVSKNIMDTCHNIIGHEDEEMNNSFFSY